jgi:hypothetical protein
VPTRPPLPVLLVFGLLSELCSWPFIGALFKNGAFSLRNAIKYDGSFFTDYVVSIARYQQLRRTTFCCVANTEIHVASANMHEK